MTLQNISRRVVESVLVNISPSNIFPILPSQDFAKIIWLLLAAVSILKILLVDLGDTLIITMFMV